MFYHVFCINRNEAINTFKKRTKYFFSPAFTLLISRFRLTLLNLFFNNLPISVEGPLNCICTHGTTKVNIFIQKHIDNIQNYVQKFFSTAQKVSKYGVFSGPYFAAFGLNTDIYSVNFRIQSECGKIWTRKKLRIWTLRSVYLKFCRRYCVAFP